ncbi:coproporphyrinogen III oxidase [Besnoitia besnoiti]|uniref:coproporphyrinogen oxidase n=1 Tax=Besnoitia besnoiti TaxID=94643 RepID=A0A2A9MBZ2_BESBE|nr:coproporphyrinogen III oxidase [Besnoitia besnoiti]PFH35389.1 coproporphyrinogen III oxidase [Besnoitia besnoiti]
MEHSPRGDFKDDAAEPLRNPTRPRLAVLRVRSLDGHSPKKSDGPHSSHELQNVSDLQCSKKPKRDGASRGEPADGDSFLWWFGGGTDLSPSYIFEDDCVFFHEKLREQCNRHDPKYYARFKRWCDTYFRNHHRSDARGIGGIFFDDLNDNMLSSPEKFFAFAEDGLKTFIAAYVPILAKRKDEPFTEREKIWQQIRRGRYVEFNLVHDRGTKFGLQVPGSRVESILLSLPLTARWEYCHEAEKGSREEEAQLLFAGKPRDWIPIDETHLEGFSWPTESGARV